MSNTTVKDASNKITATLAYEKSKTETYAALILGGLNLYEIFTDKDPLTMIVTGIFAISFGVSAVAHRARANALVEQVNR